MRRVVTWVSFALTAALLLWIADSRAEEYKIKLTREHRVLVRLEGNDHWLACFSSTAVPGQFEDCTIIKQRLSLTCTINPETRAFDCQRNDL